MPAPKERTKSTAVYWPNEDDLALVEQAARRVGLSASNFTRTAAVEAARRKLAEVPPLASSDEDR